MKILILLFIAFGFIGFVSEWIFRIITDKSLSVKEKFKELKLLLMMPVYSGACVLIGLLYKIPIMQDIKFLPLLMFLGMLIADAFEFGYGMLFNKLLKLDIWNYSGQYIILFGKRIPLNLMGQIDLFHSVLWCALTIIVIYFSQIIEWLAK